LVIFNRPDKTRKVMNVIASVRPATLIVVADGPRPKVPEEAKKCEEVRCIIGDAIDWPSVFIEHFSDTNIGCCSRTISGLDLLFR
jgi:hypothetical protein